MWKLFVRREERKFVHWLVGMAMEWINHFSIRLISSTQQVPNFHSLPNLVFVYQLNVVQCCAFSNISCCYKTT